ncbi:MAG: hypothetical protein AB8D78_00295 [Akkermansiaceae bacterium]
MKIILFLFGIIAAGIVGYSFEPDMRIGLTGKPKDYVPKPAEPEVEPVSTVVVKNSDPETAIDPATWPADRLPAKVELKGDVEISNETGDIKMTITAGNRVDLVRVDGENVIISPGSGPLEGTVPIVHTNLIEQLTALAKILPPVDPSDPVDPPVVASNTGENTGTVETPTEVAVVNPEMTSDPVEPEVAVVEPEEDPTSAPASGDVVAIMQASIKAGDIQEFTFDQVLDWAANDAAEEIEGESFQTGIASYKAETVFGVKTIQAKALIQEGKVVRWLWPKSGMEIK